MIWPSGVVVDQRAQNAWLRSALAEEVALGSVANGDTVWTERCWARRLVGSPTALVAADSPDKIQQLEDNMGILRNHFEWIHVTLEGQSEIGGSTLVILSWPQVSASL